VAAAVAAMKPVVEAEEAARPGWASVRPFTAPRRGHLVASNSGGNVGAAFGVRQELKRGDSKLKCVVNVARVSSGMMTASLQRSDSLGISATPLGRSSVANRQSSMELPVDEMESGEFSRSLSFLPDTQLPLGPDEGSSAYHAQTRGAPQLPAAIQRHPSVDYGLAEGSPGFHRHGLAPPHRAPPPAPHRSWANARRTIVAARTLREESSVTFPGEQPP
jgi:hypothetical protein